MLFRNRQWNVDNADYVESGNNVDNVENSKTKTGRVEKLSGQSLSPTLKLFLCLL